jgi:hypothetical protein
MPLQPCVLALHAFCCSSRKPLCQPCRVHAHCKAIAYKATSKQMQLKHRPHSPTKEDWTPVRATADRGIYQANACHPKCAITCLETAVLALASCASALTLTLANCT